MRYEFTQIACDKGYALLQSDRTGKFHVVLVSEDGSQVFSTVPGDSPRGRRSLARPQHQHRHRLRLQWLLPVLRPAHLHPAGSGSHGVRRGTGLL